MTSTLLFPTSFLVKPLCLVKLDSSTTSKSTITKNPIPNLASISTTVEPIPPTPTINTVD